MAFHVIFIAPGLTTQERALATAAGPPYASAAAPYPDLLARAGFDEIEEVDSTDQYRVTAEKWLEESARASDDLAAVFGIEEFEQSQREREETLTAIDDGLLRRSLFVAARN
jgi:hypothetical protein